MRRRALLAGAGHLGQLRRELADVAAESLGLLGGLRVDLLARLAEKVLGLRNCLADDVAGLLAGGAGDVADRSGRSAGDFACLLLRGTRSSGRGALCCCWSHLGSSVTGDVTSVSPVCT